MPAKKRFKTKYPGVYFIEGNAVGRSGPEKIYYIRYKRDGKLVEEKAGRQFKDDMTPAKASGIRSKRIEGKQLSNVKRRESNISKVTIQRLADQYFTLKENNKAKGVDLGRYNKYLKAPFGNKDPETMVKLDTDRLRVKLLKTLSPQTTKHILALLKRIINFGSDRGLCKGMHFKITMPRVDNIKTEDLTKEELGRLLEVLEITSYKTASFMMKLALFTGMRRGELFKLQWSDVDLNRGFIHIREPKGGKSQKIPLNDYARAVFESIPRQDESYIFPARGGGPRISIARDVRAIANEAGLPPDFRPLHGLRHLYATLLASSGQVDMYTLQKLMTHKSPVMTQRYAHLRDEALKSAANQTDAIFNNIFDEEKLKTV